MDMFYIVKINSAGEVLPLVGSSPLSGKPYWGKPLGQESAVQPLVFRSRDYAEFCTDIAKRDDPEAAGYTFEVRAAKFI